MTIAEIITAAIAFAAIVLSGAAFARQVLSEKRQAGEIADVRTSMQRQATAAENTARLQATKEDRETQIRWTFCQGEATDFRRVYELTNVGGAAAHDVYAVPPADYKCSSDLTKLPNGVSIATRTPWPFYLEGGMTATDPAYLSVRWDGGEEKVELQ